MQTIAEILSKELNETLPHVQNVIELLDGGNTVPFIARYRKELHGGMDDTALRTLADRLTYLRNLAQRRDEITRSIAAQEKLTDELSSAIQAAKTLAELEAVGRAAVLIPSPNVAENHQYYNAKVLQSVGCAQMALEGDNLEQEIYQTLTKVLGGQNSGVLRQMAENYSKLNIPDPMSSAEFIAQTLKQL